jgi:hypothetical protein
VTEFFRVARYQMQVPGTDGAAGGIIMPSGLASHTLTRRRDRLDGLGKRLLDPQMYLADLQPDRCREVCTKLASYPWFLAEGVADYDSGQQTQAQWRAAEQARITERWRRTPTQPADIEQAVDLCIGFQRDLGVEAIILPSPLTRDQASAYAVETEWLELGVARAHALAPGLPAYATIAISDTCLRGFGAYDNTLIDVILDQVTARAPDGAYVVLEQANETTYNCTSENTVAALVRLVHGLKAGGLQRVIVCYAGSAGLITLLVGADAWATGWYRGERRLRLADFELAEGRAMPAYYSHPGATEFHLANDLTRIRDAGHFERIADETVYSSELIRALRSGRSAADVVPWQPRQSNVSAARAHFATAMIRETNLISGLPADARIRYGRDWLTRASETAATLYQVGEFNPRTELDHQRAWRAAFELVVGRI